MISTRSLAVALGSLLAVVACSRGARFDTDTVHVDTVDTRFIEVPGNSKVLYETQTHCAGSGGMYNCTTTNPTSQTYGPFDVELEFTDNHGLGIGKSTVTNDDGLEPQGSWEFTVTGSPTAKGIRVLNVTSH